MKITMRCEDCGHRQTVRGVEVDGRRYFGSGFDFCDVCDGKPIEVRVGYKLFRQRKDGTLGPLFINKRLRLKVGVTYAAEDHPTKGYAHRPGWHLSTRPHAPHLSTRGRVWCRVEYEGGRELKRPKSQGGLWILADRIRIVEIMR